MKHASAILLAFFLASAVFAQLAPGPVVQKGQGFPLIVDFNRDGVDDLVQDKTVILSDGTAPVDVHDLGIPAAENVVGVLDANGDHIPDLLTMQKPIYDPLGNPYGRYMYRVYLGDGSGHFTQGLPAYADGLQPYIADVDGDGKDDLVTSKPILDDTWKHEVGADLMFPRVIEDGLRGHEVVLAVAVDVGDVGLQPVGVGGQALREVARTVSEVDAVHVTAVRIAERVVDRLLHGEQVGDVVAVRVEDADDVLRGGNAEVVHVDRCGAVAEDDVLVLHEVVDAVAVEIDDQREPLSLLNDRAGCELSENGGGQEEGEKNYRCMLHEVLLITLILRRSRSKRRRNFSTCR